jgi:hypothetical protein
MNIFRLALLTSWALLRGFVVGCLLAIVVGLALAATATVLLDFFVTVFG